MTEETYYARKDYPYEGGDTFSVPFSYIKGTYVAVYVNDTKTTGWTWLNDSQIKITSPELASGDTISIRRETPITNKLVTFTDTSILDEDTQNLAQEQVFDAVQELYDGEKKFQIDINEDFTDLTTAVNGEITTFKQDVTNSISVYQSETNGRIDDLSTTFQQASTSAKAYMEQAEEYKNQASGYATTAATEATLASDWADKMDAPVADGKYSAKYQAERANSIVNSATEAIETTKSAAIGELGRTKQSHVDTINQTGANNLRELQVETDKARDYAMKAVGWNITYESDGTEDCLEFIDRTPEEIQAAKDYIIIEKENAITSIQQAATNAVTATSAGVIDTITNAKNSALGEITSTKNTALNAVDGRKDTSLGAIDQRRADAIAAIEAKGQSATASVETTRANAVNVINQTVEAAKTAALNAIGQNNSTGARGEAISTIATARNQGVSQLNSIVTSATTEINQDLATAKDYAEKAIGWDIDYETDGEEDCLVFTDRTTSQIAEATSYVEDARDAALGSITSAKTSATDAITEAKNTATAAVAGTQASAITAINDAKTSATAAIAGTQASVVSAVETQGQLSVGSVTAEKTASISLITATTSSTLASATLTIEQTKQGAVGSINAEKTSAIGEINSTISAAMTDIELNRQICEEMAERATFGWNIEFQDDSIVFTAVEPEEE